MGNMAAACSIAALIVVAAETATLTARDQHRRHPHEWAVIERLRRDWKRDWKVLKVREKRRRITTTSNNATTTTAANSTWASDLDQKRRVSWRWTWGMRYLPALNALVCTPPKTGSTTVLANLYKFANGRPFEGDDTTMEFHDSLYAPIWHGLFDEPPWASLMSRKPTFAVAIVRDPVERLESAFNDKFRCLDLDEHPWKHWRDRERMTLRLLALVGYTIAPVVDGDSDPVACFSSFDQFVSIVYLVHAQGKAAQLDPHLLPQKEACFRHASPDKWDFVGEIRNPKALASIEKLMTDRTAAEVPSAGPIAGSSSAASPSPHRHHSLFSSLGGSHHHHHQHHQEDPSSSYFSQLAAAIASSATPSSLVGVKKENPSIAKQAMMRRTNATEAMLVHITRGDYDALAPFFLRATTGGGGHGGRRRRN